MTDRQAAHLIHELLMQANVAGRLPIACKGAGQMIEPWPPSEGEPTGYHNALDREEQSITFQLPDGDHKFRIRIERA